MCVCLSETEITWPGYFMSVCLSVGGRAAEPGPDIAPDGGD